MWKARLVVLVLAVSAEAETYPDMLLPKARLVRGIVVDQKGKPILGARFDYSNDLKKTRQTDLQGRFAFKTRAPSLVIRKTGFRSILLRTTEATDARITMQSWTGQSFPSCSDTSQFDSLQFWSPSLWFPRLPGVRVTRQVSDIDYAARSYLVETQQGTVGIRHGSGPFWSFGFPADVDVWQSSEYEEMTFTQGTVTVTDARGKLSNGNRWRYLGKVGESASYSEIDEATAKILDRVLDGACLHQ